MTCLQILKQKTIAKLYRQWANSSDDLSKKYGKKSVYDLDEISSNPYGGSFLKSYKVGKTKFDSVWLSTASGSGYINLSKGGEYKYSYDYKRKEWWNSSDGTTLSNPIDSNEKNYYTCYFSQISTYCFYFYFFIFMFVINKSFE